MSVCLLFLFCLLRVFISRSHENRSNHCRMLGPCVSETGRIKVQKGNTVLPVVGWGGGWGGELFTKMAGFLVVSFRKDICVFWYLIKCELTSDGCQYLFVLCGPWYLYTFALE